MFGSTLALWPALITEINSYNFPSLQASGWWSLLLLTAFSIMVCAISARSPTPPWFHPLPFFSHSLPLPGCVGALFSAFPWPPHAQ